MIFNQTDKIKEIFKDKIVNAKKIALTTHINPDGDGLSACIAFSIVLRNVYNIDTDILINSEFPTFLNFLNYKEQNITRFNNKQYDILIILDCNERERIDSDKEIFDFSDYILAIDHHILKQHTVSDNYDYYIDENAVSTGIMLHRFLKDNLYKLSDKQKQDYANCIYTSILNDTDNFINDNTDEETYLVSAELIKYGLKPSYIVNRFLFKKSFNYLKFAGETLATLNLSKSKKIAFYYSTNDMLIKNNLDTEAYSKMMRWTKGMQDVEIQVLFQQYDENEFRVSLRSETINVAKLAQHYGGGGHHKAAGFKINGDLNTVQSEVINYIESQMI